MKGRLLCHWILPWLAQLRHQPQTTVAIVNEQDVGQSIAREIPCLQIECARFHFEKFDPGETVELCNLVRLVRTIASFGEVPCITAANN